MAKDPDNIKPLCTKCGVKVANNAMQICRPCRSATTCHICNSKFETHKFWNKVCNACKQKVCMPRKITREDKNE